MNVKDELEQFELRTAADVWENLNSDDKARLLKLPRRKEATWDMTYFIQNGKEYPNYKHTGYADEPEMSHLIEIGVAEDRPFMDVGPPTYRFATPAYQLTRFGAVVQRYGNAVEVLEKARRAHGQSECPNAHS